MGTQLPALFRVTSPEARLLRRRLLAAAVALWLSLCAARASQGTLGGIVFYTHTPLGVVLDVILLFFGSWVAVVLLYVATSRIGKK